MRGLYIEATEAIIVSVTLPNENEQDNLQSLDELAGLLSTLGIKTVGKFLQKRQKLTPNCFLGTGKVEELKNFAAEHNAQIIAFDRSLSAPQVRNLEEMTGRKIWDRAGVILEIFAQHARSNQAKTQVEIAKLEYLLPRLSGAWTHLSRQTGGKPGSRGMGEKQIEIDRRRARERIARLQKRLEQIQKERQTQRKARRGELKVAIVGYTNSGKTSIMHMLTKTDLLGENALFATLDASVRVIDPQTRPKILLADTVGFIRNLPHSLIESFKSTLEEVLEADLLLHVVDTSYERYKDQIKTTEEVLKEIGADHIPTIFVFNKIDQVDDPFLAKVLRQAYPGSISVSAFSGKDMERLRAHIFHFFEQNFVRTKLKVRQDDTSLSSLIYRNSLVLDVDYSEDEFAIFDIQVTQEALARLTAVAAKVEHETL